VLATRAVAYDISELHAVRSELTRLGAEQQMMLDNELVGIVKIRDGQITWANRGASRIFGYTDGTLAGQPARLLHVDEESYQRALLAAGPTLERGGIYRSRIEMGAAHGRSVWIDAIGVMMSASLQEALWIFADASDMKAYQDKVEHIAFHDSLTGLPNRLLLRDRLEMALAAVARTGRHPAVCYIDLDGFKPINDRYGHEAGDHILIEVAHRLAACLRANDTVARIGGDEFVVILDGLEAGKAGNTAIERLREAVALPYLLEGHPPLSVSASIGVAQVAEGQADAELLLRLADAAMYDAKRLGKNRICRAPVPAPQAASKPD
jgi:diguanylate cyclase (GGDEF)-like protein/PAS domain S-box-containing protein